MVYQISVFMENRPGRLYDLTQALERANINLKAASIAETGDFGIIRCIVSDPDAAYDALTAEGFTVKKAHVVGVEVDDAPGSLSGIARALGERGINILYLYAFSIACRNKAILILKTDDIERTKDVLASALPHRIIGQEDIAAL